ncbi:MAG TPA: putative lipid II flippase FtsW [Candidatus Paceibacterota bacterium]|jgi:cell division protein FtsW|nr:putative lipid II flippase FtsW [Candidatus Paceibacterota bacterium]HQI25914.1 putative lipid II flippase FtsW [Candidatus Paceibacterota bacterium]HQJ83883.1 putative lipid II flippase FtsW [Candidatus Paceibacterota bacterium]
MKTAKTAKPDRFLFSLILILITGGFVIFSSAALGQVGRTSASFSVVALKQLLALFLGFVMMLIASKVPYKSWRKYSPYIFALALVLTSLVFVPGIGFGTNGARRWLDLGFTTFQPSEFLKFGLIVFLAAWLAARKEKIRNLKEGFLPFLIFLSVVCLLLLKQPDTGTLIVAIFVALSLFMIAGGRWSHLFIIILLGILLTGALIWTRPYIKDRLVTYLDPQKDSRGASWQINQSLIAIGSGGLVGRGFGQSIQKFNFLPEPIGDSIFAVAAEEFGFIGSTIIVGLFLLLALWGLKLMNKVKDSFGRLLGIGLVFLITVQSFVNIGAMIGIFPLTGLPLLFISQGGSALFFALIEVGIILNISKEVRK